MEPIQVPKPYRSQPRARSAKPLARLASWITSPGSHRRHTVDARANAFHRLAVVATKPRSHRRQTVLIAGLLCLAVVTLGCTPKNESTSGVSDTASGTSAQLALPQQTVFLVEQFCGNCHPVPAPSSFPKSNWPAEVERGFGFYFESGRSDLQVPLMIDTINYFQSQAPESIDLPTPESFPTAPTSTQFVPGPLLLSGDKISLTADIKWDSVSQSVFFSDMANARLRALSLPRLVELGRGNADQPVTLGPECVVSEGNYLCKMTECDWNQDGQRDYMVAEIGSMIISDQRLGSVAVHLGRSDGSFERQVLAEKLARPVEAVPLDYDEDGDLDVLVAEFGYNKAGCLSLLRNESTASTTATGSATTDPAANKPAANKPVTSDAAVHEVTVKAANLKYEVVDPRHGHLAILVTDINGDQKQDIVTAIGQEYEMIQVRISTGHGQYDSHVAMVLGDPAYNTSSVQVADVDQDGLPDLVHTCGDIFDSFVPKPYHGVRWIRNKGDGVWETRELGMLIGAMQSAIADFDGDGDLDIAAVGLFPHSTRDTKGVSLDSVCWWEQQPELKFVRHSIERDRSLHSSCMARDLDGDNRPELIVGEWAQGQTPASLRVFWNSTSTSQ